MEWPEFPPHQDMQNFDAIRNLKRKRLGFDHKNREQPIVRALAAGIQTSNQASSGTTLTLSKRSRYRCGNSQSPEHKFYSILK